MIQSLVYDDCSVESIGQLPPDLFAESLVDFQWKLAMAISSDTCRSLNYPYISMTLKVANSSGQITSKSFEMTIPQFQLVDFQWKLAMAISSDTCRSLNYPYISMTVKVANSSGQITSKSFEMTIPQFQNFFRQFKEMAAVLETV
ncbi:UNVERIFIED_CONTAM: hypothetical protein FKN15_028762 [Acipenser sinensis]